MASPYSNTVKMDYKTAITTNNTVGSSSSSMNPKSFSQTEHEEYKKMIEAREFQRRANNGMNQIVNRFLKYKREELYLEGYNDEEIEMIIEELLNAENNDVCEYSSDEDDDSVYSDEDTF